MSLWERLTGKVVDAAGLGQKRRAVATGIIAFDGPMSDLRLEIAIKSHPWLQNSATTSFLLAAWAAQSMQDMAAVLEATAQQHLGDPGKLPEATYLLADALYREALEWIEQAQRALAAVDANPQYELFRPLPAAAPRLDWIPEAPPVHFVAAIQAAVQLGTSAEDALNNAQSDRSRLPRRYDGAFETIEAAVRMGRAKLDQVQAAESDRQAVRLSRDIWTMLGEVVRIYFLAGQQATRPSLIDPRYDAAANAAARAARLPPPATWQSSPGAAGVPGAPGAAGSAGTAGPAGARATERRPSQPPPPPPRPAEPTLGERLGMRFDAWALTEHGAKATYQNDRTRLAELEAFWRADTNPDETYRLFGLISSAIQAGKVAARPGEFSRACPWASTFVALADVSLGTERFSIGQLFTLKVGQEGEYFGRGFERLGFLPGTQRPKPRAQPPAEPEPPGQPAAASPPTIDTRHHEERGSRPPPASAQPGRAEPEPPGPDIWLLTAAFERPRRRANPADTESVKRLWQADPDPASTVRFHDEVMAAVSAGSVAQHGDEALRDCPWSQVYVAVSRVVIGGVQLERNEKFALDVGVTGGTFRRSIARLGLIATRP